MASLQSRLSDLITAIGTDYKTFRTWMFGSATGTLASLTTTDKTSLVAAINETKAGNSGSPPAASETVSGIAELATQVETNAGTDDLRIVTPLKFQTRLAAYAQPLDSDLTSIAAVTTTAYGRAFLALADQAALMTLIPAATELVAGVAELATQTETNTGTDDARMVTPLKFQTRLAAYAQPLDADLTSIAALTTTSYGRAFLALADQTAFLALHPAASTTVASIIALATQTEVNTGTDNTKAVTPLTYQTRLAAYAMPLTYLDTDVTLAANSNVKVPSQAAVKAYADNLIAAANAMVYKGVIDASTNPNYPAANAGDTYRISVAGKIGGASGLNVEVGDMIIALTDGTAAGTQAAVGANWNIVQANIDGAVVGPASAVSGNIASYSGTTGKLIADSGFSPSNGAIGAGSATVLPTSAQVVAYAQPLDADLTSIAAVATTSYGRAFLALANQAGLMALLAAASETVAGILEIATQVETDAATDDARAITPLKLASNLTTKFGNPDTDLAALYATAKT